VVVHVPEAGIRDGRAVRTNIGKWAGKSYCIVITRRRSVKYMMSIMEACSRGDYDGVIGESARSKG
jgi:hypothetical protein